MIAIELLAACQAIEFLRPLKTTVPIEEAHKVVRSVVRLTHAFINSIFIIHVHTEFNFGSICTYIFNKSHNDANTNKPLNHFFSELGIKTDTWLQI